MNKKIVSCFLSLFASALMAHAAQAYVIHKDYKIVDDEMEEWQEGETINLTEGGSTTVSFSKVTSGMMINEWRLYKNIGLGGYQSYETLGSGNSITLAYNKKYEQSGETWYLVPCFTYVTYTLSYDPNGGEWTAGAPEGGTYKYNESVTAPGADVVEREGYAFKGWKSARGSLIAVGEPFDGSDLGITSDGQEVVLYAQWISILQGEWNTDFTSLLAYAKANDLPIVVVWGNTSCSHCNKLKAVLENESITEWAATKSAVLVLKHEKYSSQDADYLAAKEWIKTLGSNVSPYPFVGVYWNTNGVVACSSAFTGRRGHLPVTEKSLAGEFAVLLDDALSAYEMQSALDNHDLKFELDNETYSEIVDDDSAVGGSCLKLGPLDEGGCVGVGVERTAKKKDYDWHDDALDKATAVMENAQNYYVISHKSENAVILDVTGSVWKVVIGNDGGKGTNTVVGCMEILRLLNAINTAAAGLDPVYEVLFTDGASTTEQVLSAQDAMDLAQLLLDVSDRGTQAAEEYLANATECFLAAQANAAYEWRGAWRYNLKFEYSENKYCRYCGNGTYFIASAADEYYPNVLATWQDCCVPCNDSSDLRLELYNDGEWDGQTCYIDNVRWVDIGGVLGAGLGLSVRDGWVVRNANGLCVASTDCLTAGEERSILLTVSGPGTLKFQHRGSVWNSNYEYGVNVDGESKVEKCGYWGWSTQEISIPTKGEHTIYWYVRNALSDDDVDGEIFLRDVEWIPAPANLVVSFDGEGGLVDGSEKSAQSFATGECYGSLPTPVRDNRTFKGWYTSDGEKVIASDYVIPSATNLFAHWVAKLDGAAGEVVKGNSEIYSDRSGVVFPVEEDDPYEDWDWPSEDNYFEVTCSGETIVTFDWVFEASPKLGAEYYDEEWWNEYWWYGDGYEELPQSFMYQEFYVDGERIDEPEDSYVRYPSTMMYGQNVSLKDASQRRTVRAFLTPGNHVLRWNTRKMWNQNVNVRSAVENFKVETVEMQTDIVDWAKLLVDFQIWKPDNLSYLRDSVYGARIAANPNDYEARVIRAAIKVALLAENKEVRDFIKDCGWTIADYTMKQSGEFCGLKNLAPANDIVDRLSPEVLTALDDALADLNAIPENWNGSIELSPKKYEILNESVYVDLAEITILKAALESARASILLVKGYDFTMDYIAVSNSIKNAEFAWDVLEQAPQAGCIRDANALVESKTWFKTSLQHIRRADQIILWRSNPAPHFFEYDLVDADNLARARLYLEQLIGSLDHPETIDLPYFVDKFGYNGETLPMGMFRQLYLGAIFAGRVTKDLIPEVQINPAMLYMDTVEDTTLGGLLPDLGFEEFATLFPCGQHWSLSLYDTCKPQSRLLKSQTLMVVDEALCDGTLEYTVNLAKLNHVTAQCIVDGLPVDTISVDENDGTEEAKSVAVQNGSEYRLVFTTGDRSMKSRQQVFDITSVPEVSPVADGSYSQTINGVTWNFTVSDDEATVTGASGAISGDLVIPEKLGGRSVVAIADEAFRKSSISSITIPAGVRAVGVEAFSRATSLQTIRFLGDEPTVGDDAFNKVTATVVFKGGTALSNLSEGKWYGMTVQYASDSTNEDLRVCASLPDGYEFNGMATLSLSVSGDATIYFTMNGAEPTTNALVYSSPISVSITTRIKYFAVDNQNGDTGPIGSMLLKLVTPDAALLSNSEYSKTVNGIGWSYQEYANGVRLTGNSGTAAGDKVIGAVVIPDAINWQSVKVIGAGLFASCDGITSVKIPSTVTDIERDAFRGCTRLESITLPDGLKSIADGAFERCTSLTNIVIPATVTNIGYFAFRDCLRLADVVLQGSPPRQDLGVYMGVPAFTVISGRMGSATAIVYAGITNKTEEITVPESWLDEIAAAHDKPAGADSYQAAFKDKYGDDLKAALTKPTGKYDLKGNPLYVWQDYVAGTDPLDEEDKFTATITMEDGVPVVRWSPELPDAAAATRKYTVYGATALNGKWDDVSDKTDQQRHDLGYQFFSVTVEMK